MKYRIILSIFFIAFGYYQSPSQGLMELLENKNNFKEIQEVAEIYYNDLKVNNLKKRPTDPKYKHWKRWEWYNRDRLDDGKIFNHHKETFNAVINEKRRYKNGFRNTNSLWTFTGPDSYPAVPSDIKRIGLGRIDRIAFHPSNANVIFVGTPNGGIWKTTDGGNSWIPLDDFLPTLGVSEIVISPTNPNLMYVLTGSGDDGMAYPSYGIGVLKSLDGGNTFMKTSDLPTPDAVGYHMAMDPNDDQTLMAATTAGLFKTVDGGTSWIDLPGSTSIFDVKYKPGSSDTLYACDASMVYYSYTGGDASEWNTSTFSHPFPSGRKTIAVAPSNKEIVYLLSGPGNFSGNFGGLYQSVNGGGYYQRKSISPDILGVQAEYDQCMAVSNVLSNVVLVGGITVWRSINNGVGWTNVTTYDNPTTIDKYVHYDIHDIKFNPLNDHLYAATDGGFYKSTDLGANWNNLSEGLAVAMFYRIAGYPSISRYILCGAQGNGLKYRRINNSAFDHIASNDGYDVTFTSTDASRFYASINTGIYKYWNNGDDVEEILNDGIFFHELAAHESDPDILFAGNTVLYKTVNAGDNWTTIGIKANKAITSCPTDHNRIYVAASDMLNRLDGLGSTVTRIDNKPGMPDTLTFTDIQVSPINSSIVFVSIGNFDDGHKVYKSTTSGGSWTNISGSLPNVPVNCLAVLANGDVYAGTDIGVYYLANGVGDWIPFKNGLPNVTVTDFIVNTSANIIRAGTFGRGVWTAPLADGNCVNDLVWTVTTNLSGYQYFEANNRIENKSIIDGGIGTSVFFKAGQFIDLKPGFHAKDDGMIFEAKLGPCSNGGIPSVKDENVSNGQK